MESRLGFDRRKIDGGGLAKQDAREPCDDRVNPARRIEEPVLARRAPSSSTGLVKPSRFRSRPDRAWGRVLRPQNSTIVTPDVGVVAVDFATASGCRAAIPATIPLASGQKCPNVFVGVSPAVESITQRLPIFPMEGRREDMLGRAEVGRATGAASRHLSGQQAKFTGHHQSDPRRRFALNAGLIVGSECV